LNVTGERDKAAQAVQEHMESYPQDDSDYILLGLVDADRGQYEEAAKNTR
jgi:TolA-binding protein